MTEIFFDPKKRAKDAQAAKALAASEHEDLAAAMGLPACRRMIANQIRNFGLARAIAPDPAEVAMHNAALVYLREIAAVNRARAAEILLQVFDLIPDQRGETDA